MTVVWVRGECANCGTTDLLAQDWLCNHCVRLATVRAQRGLDEISRYLAAYALYQAWCSERGLPA